ncbi:MAG TPA: response regulator transcription factor [Anaerolineales bacterium]|nr:response regulator transcription factor [Anaerolineales bacterium]
MIIVYVKTCSPNPLILLLADRHGSIRTVDLPEQSNFVCPTKVESEHKNPTCNETHPNLQLWVLAPEVQGTFQASTEFCDVAVSLQAVLNTLLPQAFTPPYDQNIDKLSEALGKNDSKIELTAGWTMLVQPSSKHLVTYPVSSHPRLPSRREATKHKYGGLTARERQVAEQIAQGKSNQEIAAELFVGLKTVETHVTHILSKLGFASRAQVAAWAVAKGLADAPADLVTLIRKDVESL